MKKLIVLILIPFFSFGQSKSIFKGLEYGMTKSEAKKEFKKNKKDYTTVDIGNGFLFRIYQQNFLYDNEKLVGITLNPKGSAFGMQYDLTKNYLTATRTFFESLNYETFIENKWYDAPINYLKSASKWGLILNKKDKSTLIQMYPIALGDNYLVKLVIWDYNTWMGYYNAEMKRQNDKAKDSGF